MLRSMVGLLSAVGTAISLVASWAHGDLFWAAVVEAAAATGLAAYLALSPTKKSPSRLARASPILYNLHCKSPLLEHGYNISVLSAKRSHCLLLCLSGPMTRPSSWSSTRTPVGPVVL
jgi:hypothetical protein